MWNWLRKPKKKSPYVEALDLDDRAFVEFVADVVAIGPPAAWTMYVFALPNVKVWIKLSADLAKAPAGKELPSELDGFIRMIAKTIDGRTSETEKNRLTWQIVSCLVLRATDLAATNEKLVDSAARIWLPLIQGGAGISEAMRYNQAWSAEEKSFFSHIKNEKSGMQHVIQIEAPKFIRRHPAIEQLADDNDLGFLW